MSPTKKEILNLLSRITKLVNELYADVFSRVYGIHTIGLRYFNVFGPKQNPNNPYAAVIPIFCKHFIEGTDPTINGDGETSRDFTFVENAIQANILMLLKENIEKHDVFNVALGDQITLNNLIGLLQQESGKNIKGLYTSERVGDIRHSKASIEKIIEFCGYNPKVNFENGLKILYKYYIKKYAKQ